MFLKKLILNGFKSFPDHTELTFVKGISAIVGPNGCGKSNIVDAIKWVVGEQRTKMLRANSMVDVIFKGTEDKKGLGRGEVRLVLVNEQNILPIDYNEVEVSRVIFANGENEYYINKKKVRLKDVQELFFDTGVGKAAYSVMEQGKIDLILSNKPEDRRYIVEEAAGITKYKVKREDAGSRLKQANDNIVRIKDIIGEVRSQYNHMKKQAEKAERFEKIYDKELKLEIELNLNRIKKQKSTEIDLSQKVGKVNNDLKKVEEELNNLEGGVESQMNNLTDLENQKIDNQREIFSLQSEIKILSAQKETKKDQAYQYEVNIKSDTERVNHFDENIKGIDDELNKIKDNKKELEEKIISIMKDIQFYKENIKKLDEEIVNSDQNIVDLKNKINYQNEELEKKQSEQKDITNQLISKIDQTLNLFDMNEDEIVSFKEKINENINFVITNLNKKTAFLDDILRGGYVSKDSEEFLKMLSKLKDEIVIIEEKLTELNDNTKNYIKTTETFMRDFFGPEGALQLKRNVEHKINDILNNIQETNTNIENIQTDIIKQRNKKDEYNKILNDLNINITTVREKQNSSDNDIKRLLSLKNHNETSRDELQQKIDFYNKKIKEMNTGLEKIEDDLKKLNEKKEKIEKKLLKIDIDIKDENKKMSNQQLTIKEINNKRMSKKDEVEKINIKLTEAKTTISNIYNAFYENFSIDLNEYENKKGYSSERNYDEVRKELSEIKAEKHSLGNVNLMAIEESKSLKERYDLLQKQLMDLDTAKKDIIEMIDKINIASEELFHKTFKEIKTNFHKIFRKLFDGGNAEITLTKPDNILETGIDIIAHPPGQKTQSITLLSGGQRTMTAIALMFATFIVRPSPFCLLDEIDAALDEQNVRRFINLLYEFKDHSQFIIITHNSKTISASDVMYGVTQEEKGISKIVSARFAEKNS